MTGFNRDVLLVFLIALTVSACSVPSPSADGPAPSAPVTLLAFGDTGYHYDYLEKKDYEKVVTEQRFLAKERQDWIDDKRPIEELAFPPMYRLPKNGSIVAASGQAPVAKAMRQYCAQNDCDFAAMLGDNIYPDGATAGPEDARRFRDLFTVPFASLGAGKRDFRIYTVLGNHDWHTSRAGALAQVRFMENTPPFYMNGLFYRVVPPASGGRVEIFAIDTEMLLAATTVFESVLADDGSEAHSDEREQLEPWAAPQNDAERDMVGWLDRALASSGARWKIVMGHHPLWSSSGGKFEQARALRRLILPVLCAHADMYLAGHEHTLEVHSDDCSTAGASRGKPLPQIVSGSGAKMRPINTAFIRHQLKANPQLKTFWSRGLTWGFSHLTFESDRVVVRMIETPTDGSGTPRVSYEHVFERRSAETPATERSR
jgi:tartrate-resistant acid phosphatase type 5